jgi:hypothetical protein
MNETPSFLRALTNILVSGILLAIAIVNMNLTIERPAGIHTWAITAGNIVPLLAYLGLIFITALFAWAFWRRRTRGSSNVVSAALNGLSCALLIAAVVYGTAMN